MREYRRKELERPRLNLVRGTDGRLRSVNGDDDGVAAPQIKQQSPPNTVEPEVEPSDQVYTEALPAKRKIKLRLPRPSFSRIDPRKLSRKQLLMASAMFGALVIVGFIVYSIPAKHDVKKGSQAANVNVKDTKGPEFEALLPQGKSIEDLGGWARVSPADKDPVFAYVDIFNNVQLNISQQQLPSNLQTNTAQEIEKLAENFAARDKIVAGDFTAYLGTSIRGPQSLIFVKNNLLVLIKSSSKLTDEQWADYILALN